MRIILETLCTLLPITVISWVSLDLILLHKIQCQLMQWICCGRLKCTNQIAYVLTMIFIF